MVSKLVAATWNLSRRKTPLPCKKSKNMESALDYVCRVSLGICYRRTMLDVPVEIAEDAELDSIRPAKKGEA